MIRVLICDDDATSRHLVKRAVSRTFNARLFEASDGLEALDTLQTESIDLVVTEVELPLMDGLDVIRAMRASPSSASIPVLIISAHRHADTVQEAARLHVSDYVIKPIDVDVLTNRLGKIVRTLNERSATPRRNLGGVGPNASGMIVDGDSEFRHYFKSVVGSRCVLSMAQCGSQALRACNENPPDVLFVGTDLGLLSAAELAKRVREIGSKAIRIVAIPNRSDGQATRDRGLFDDVIGRTYDPAKLERDISNLLRPVVPFELLSEEIPNIRTRVLRVAEQVFGRMLATDVEPVSAPSAASGPHASATIAITTPKFIANVTVRFDMVSGRHLAGAFLETDPTAFGDDDIVSVAGELANVLAGRLHAVFQERQLESSVGLPVTATEPAPDDGGLERNDGNLSQHFRAVDKPVAFQLDLTVESTAPKGDAPTVDEESGVAMLRADT